MTGSTLSDGSIESAAILRPWTPTFGDIDFDSNEPTIEDITFDAHVWSPYAIPRALLLKHVYYRHRRRCSYQHSTEEFGAYWYYDNMEFEDDDFNINQNEDEFTAELCSIWGEDV